MAERLSGIGFGAREVAARIYSSMRAGGVPAGDAHRHVSAVLPGVSLRTLQRWNRGFEAEEGIFVDEKGAGRPRSVPDEKMRILVGWVLTETESGNIVRWWMHIHLLLIISTLRCLKIPFVAIY